MIFYLPYNYRYYTINRLSAQDVGEILSIVNSMGLMNIEVNDQQNKEISERFSQNLLFDPSSPGILRFRKFSFLRSLFSATRKFFCMR